MLGPGDSFIVRPGLGPTPPPARPQPPPADWHAQAPNFSSRHYRSRAPGKCNPVQCCPSGLEEVVGTHFRQRSRPVGLDNDLRNADGAAYH